MSRSKNKRLPTIQDIQEMVAGNKKILVIDKADYLFSDLRMIYYMMKIYESVGWKRDIADVEKYVRTSLLRLAVINETEIIGFIRYASDGVLFCYVAEVAVLKEFHGQGAGKLLLKSVIDECKSAGFDDRRNAELVLFAAAGQSDFYTRQNFKPTDHGHFYRFNWIEY